MGVDEVLAGRAGLLAAILDLYELKVADATGQKLKKVFDEVPNLLNTIIEAGEAGASDYKHAQDENGMPLMWTWIDQHYSLGG